MTSNRTPLLVDPVVSTQWLADHLGSDRLIVVDASVVTLQTTAGGAPRLLSGYDQYLFDGHVPGAVFADLIDDRADPFEALQTDADRTAVVYDGGDGRFAERARRLLLDLGYEQVAVLDGGLRRWRVEGRAVEDGVSDGQSAR
ncbi:MAG TPA: rhodanese-like domain-containing protein [Plantibacter sp.]|uniref:rhodanese-like domain-containing protein n=1 Tax=unclassified Plantibacter TaxID=2624265 RepID=UPI002B5B0E21|nr:rhodanese-like domain-containing protein [Plantibacter sp.]